MRYHILSASCPANRRPPNDNFLTPDEQELVFWFTSYAAGLRFEAWERSQMKGYRTTTQSNVECCIRHYRDCLYSDTNARWNCFGIVPSSVGHWYSVTIFDKLKISGKKQILEFAAGPPHGGYDALKSLYAEFAYYGEDDQVPLGRIPEQEYTTLHSFLKLAA